MPSPIEASEEREGEEQEDVNPPASPTVQADPTQGEVAEELAGSEAYRGVAPDPTLRRRGDGRKAERVSRNGI